MIATVKQAVENLEAELGDIDNSSDDPLVKIKRSLTACDWHCNHVASLLIPYKPANFVENIEIFKIHKPRLFSHIHYFRKLEEIHAKLMVQMPLQQKVIIVEYIQKMLTFFETHSDAFSYYQSGRQDQDHYFYSKFESLNLEYAYKSEHVMFSHYDGLTGRFIAYEKMERYLTEELCKLGKRKHKPSTFPKVVQWTSTERNLVELITGLNNLRCFNSGDVSVKHLLSLARVMFKVEMTDREFFTILSQIRNRKKPDSSFFDKLRHALDNMVSEF